MTTRDSTTLPSVSNWAPRRCLPQLPLLHRRTAAETIRMLAPTWLGFAPVHVANDLGCFKEEGLEVDYKFEDDRTNVLAAYARGDIEVDMRTVGEHQGRPRDAKHPRRHHRRHRRIGRRRRRDHRRVDQVGGRPEGQDGCRRAQHPGAPPAADGTEEGGHDASRPQVKDIATADTGAVFADSSIAAVATYEPFMSQAVKASARPGARVFFSSKDYPGIIIDVITAREDDLAANPKKYQSFLKCIYKAIDYSKADPDKYAELAAAHFGLTAADVKEILATSLAYIPLADAQAYLGKPGERGKLHDIFDTVMQLNLENGAADNKLDSNQQINNAVINTVTP